MSVTGSFGCQSTGFGESGRKSPVVRKCTPPLPLDNNAHNREAAQDATLCNGHRHHDTYKRYFEKKTEDLWRCVNDSGCTEVATALCHSNEASIERRKLSEVFEFIDIDEDMTEDTEEDTDYREEDMFGMDEP